MVTLESFTAFKVLKAYFISLAAHFDHRYQLYRAANGIKITLLKGCGNFYRE
jgi:hypothetical protein